MPWVPLEVWRTLSHVALEGNTITCDSYGCRTQDSFEGKLSPEDALIRFHILGWQFSEHDGRETHHCPIHF